MVPALKMCSVYWWGQASKQTVAIQSSRMERHGAVGVQNSTKPA